MTTPEFIQSAGNLIHDHNYILILAGMAVETTLGLGLIFPGVVLVVLGGFYAGLQQGNIITVVMYAVAGTLLGANVTFVCARTPLACLTCF
jgi:membrane protein DedA with SNARE-associated domain